MWGDSGGPIVITGSFFNYSGHWTGKGMNGSIWGAKKINGLDWGCELLSMGHRSGEASTEETVISKLFSDCAVR